MTRTAFRATLELSDNDPALSLTSVSAQVEIKDAAEHLRAYDQGAFGSAGFDHTVGNGQRVNKTATHGLYVKSGATSDGFRRCRTGS